MPELDIGTSQRIDARTAFVHIGTWSLVRVGAKNKLHHQDYIQFEMALENHPRRIALVQLNRQDLYNIEVGRLKRRSLKWVTEYVQRDVQAENLSRGIEQAFEYVMS